MKFLILPANFSEQEEHDYIITHILDSAVKERDVRDQQESASQLSQTSVQFSRESKEDEENEAKKSRIVGLCDGANPQVVFLRAEKTKERYADACLSVVKSPASTTSHLAANDVMKGHAEYRKLVHSPEELNSECPPQEEWPTFVHKISSRLLRYATTMNAESHNLIVKHLCHLPTFFSHKCNRRIIVSGFDTAAIYPLNPSKMLARCDSWDDFNQEEQLKMITAIPQLSLLVEQGTCTDDRMFELLPFLRPSQPAQGMAKDDRTDSRRRSLLFLCDAYFKRRANDAKRTDAVKKAKEEAAKKKKEAKEEAAKKKKEAKEEAAKKRKEAKEEAKEEAIKKKERTKMIGEARELIHKGEWSPPENDWTCFVCFDSWGAWQEVGLTEKADAANAWLQGNCDHTFCPNCAVETKVDEHSKACMSSNTKKRKSADGEQRSRK